MKNCLQYINRKMIIVFMMLSTACILFANTPEPTPVTISGNLQAGINALPKNVPGLVVEIAGGTYKENITIKGFTGTKDQYIEFRAKPDEDVIINPYDPATTAWKTVPVINIIDCAYVKIADLTVKNGGINGIVITDKIEKNVYKPIHHITLSNLIVEYNGGYGAYPDGCGIVIRGFDTTAINVSECYVEGCTVVNNNAAGVNVYGAVKNVLIKDNIVTNTGWYKNSLHRKERQLSKYSCNVIIHGHYGTKSVENVTVTGNELSYAYHEGFNGFYCEKIRVTDNYIHHNLATAIQFEILSDMLIIENNRVGWGQQAADLEGGIWIGPTKYGAIRNNIISHEGNALLIWNSEDVVVRHNQISETTRLKKDVGEQYDRVRDISTAILLSTVEFGHVIFNNQNIRIVHNTIHETGLPTTAWNSAVRFFQRPYKAVDGTIGPNMRNRDIYLINNLFSSLNNGYDYYINDFNTEYTNGDVPFENVNADYNWFYNPDHKTTEIKEYHFGTTPLNWTHDENSIKNVNPDLDPDTLRLNENSPCVDAAVTLTTVTSSVKDTVNNETIVTLAGEIGTGYNPTLPVYYFTDGFDAGFYDTEAGVDYRATGDVIRIGAIGGLTIVDLDYSNNTITVEGVHTFNTGDPVSYDYKGTAPDMGAYELR